MWCLQRQARTISLLRSTQYKYLINLLEKFLIQVLQEVALQAVVLQVVVLQAVVLQVVVAGTFLCISLSDLLPELQFHQHDRVKLTIALLLGLTLAWGVSRLESRTHDHAIDRSSQLLTPSRRWISSTAHAPDTAGHLDRHYQAPLRAGCDRCDSLRFHSSASLPAGPMS